MELAEREKQPLLGIELRSASNYIQKLYTDNKLKQ